MTVGNSLGGTGAKLARAVVIVAGVASLVASLLSFVSIWLQTKNYRKPLLQRYVIRILLMVPIYSASSWASIVSLKASLWLAPIRDIYEAFTIYTFFQLLINFLGGERALIIMTHGRPPIQHAWPLNRCLPKVDISDPHTFLAIKRGILQYAWLKPILAIVTIIMKATDTYQEGYLGLTSGYLWTGIVYNISVTLSLYSLALFWVCMHEDLKPFRPIPKFLCVKLIIFASYWQGFFLSILQWLGAFSRDVAGYTPDNLAAAIQDSLICFEMPVFAITHWYAFSWHDYADDRISAARMPVKYALRDAFGVRDLIEDTKQTLRGDNYEYRLFDSGDNVIAHEESRSRLKRVMDGMRYERGGKGKYWIPKPGEANSQTPLLHNASSSRNGSGNGSKRASIVDRYRIYGELEETTLDNEDELLFANARSLEFGDWNYPVIPANEVPQDQRLAAVPSYQDSQQPTLITKISKRKTSHAKGSEGRRKSKVSESGNASSGKVSGMAHPKRDPSASDSSQSSRSQLVDLVVKDHETEQKKAQGALGSTWNEPHPKKFRDPVEGGSGQDSSSPAVAQPNLRLEEDNSEQEDGLPKPPSLGYGAFEEERHVWDR